MCQENSCSHRRKRGSRSEGRRCGIRKSELNPTEKVTTAHVHSCSPPEQPAHHVGVQALGVARVACTCTHTESARRAAGAGDVRLRGRRDTPTLKGLTSIFVYARRVNRTWLILSRKICPRARCTSTTAAADSRAFFPPDYTRLLRPRPPYTFFAD